MTNAQSGSSSPIIPPVGVVPSVAPATMPVVAPANEKTEKNDTPIVTVPPVPMATPLQTHVADPVLPMVKLPDSPVPVTPTPAATPTPAVTPLTTTTDKPTEKPVDTVPSATPQPSTFGMGSAVPASTTTTTTTTATTSTNSPTAFPPLPPTVSVEVSPGSSKPASPPKKPGFSLKYIVPVLILFVLLIGGGIALLFSQMNSENRGQASAISSKGSVNTVSCTQVKGWTCDAANFSKALQVAVYYDTFTQDHLITVGDANVNRTDVASQCGGTMNHGFVIDIPADKVPVGNHRLIVKGIPVSSNGDLNPADMFDLPLADPVNSSFNVSCGTISSSCTLSFTATEQPPQGISCTKDSYQDELSNSAGNYTYAVPKTTFEPGESVLFRIMMKNQGNQPQTFKLTDILTQNNLDQLDFVDTNCGTYNSATRTISWTTNPVSGSDSITCGFRARVKRSVTQSITITNTANIVAGTLNASCTAPITVTIPNSSPSPSPSVSPSPSPTPTPSPAPVCGGNCANSSQCPQNHTCNNNRCELTACTTGATCTTDRCQVTSCGSTCNSSSDCPNDHTCNNGTCVLSVCTTGSSCTTDRCHVTSCGNSCSSTSECPNDHTCNNGTCKLTACVNGATCTSDQCRVTSCGSSCGSTSECPNDHTCSNGTCVLSACTNGSTSCSNDRCRITSCGATCGSNVDCPNDHTCNNNRCVLSVCLSGASCDINKCNVTTTSVSQTPVTPAARCNETCASNADCSASNHICVDTSQGRRCRLESNVNSTTCGAAVEQPVVQISPKPIQPQSLPVAGSSDILKAVGVGATAVILGAVGLLLL